jgi:glycosyltransferase involved in cell wall biosynthesis
MKLLADSKAADAMGAEGRRIVLRRYTSEAIADRLEELYDSLSVANMSRARALPTES